MQRRIAASVGLLGLIGAVWFGVNGHVVGTEPPAPPSAARTPVPAKVPAAESSFEPLIQRLQPLLKQRFPKCGIEIVGRHDRVIINGSATTAQEAAAIVVAVQTAVDLHSPIEHPQSGQVINLLEIPGEAQVLLHVRIIEADRHIVEETFQRLSKNAAAAVIGATPPSGAFATAVVEKATAKLATDPSSTTKSEPSITVLSGHVASFVSGGNFAVPITVGEAGTQSTTTTFRTIGTDLVVKPTVLDGQQIRLELTCESSQLDEANAVAGIPGITTCRINIKVALNPDQTAVMLMPTLPAKENNRQAREAARKAGEPANSERCLFITVTPEVLKPMETNEVSPQPLAFPTASVYTPIPHAGPSPVFGLASAPSQLFPTLPPPLALNVQRLAAEPAAGLWPSPPLPFGPFGPIQQVGGWQPMPPTPEPWPGYSRTTSRIEHLECAMTHLEAAGLTDQVVEIQKEIELERKSETRRELKQREQQLEALQLQIENLRRSLSPHDEPSPQ